MRIIRIVMENFKTYKYQEFDIEGKDLVLLTGSNGFGKTTIIDAIEWCLTGDITRLKSSYEERNTTQSEKERLENYKGILKHSNSNSNEKVKVTLHIKINEVMTRIYREQDEDNLYTETNLIFEENTPEDVKNKLFEYVGEGKFYNYHVCDTHKVFNFLNDSRQDIKKQFDNFIQQYPIANNVSKKFSELVEKLKLQEEQYVKSKISVELIENRKQELQQLKENVKILEYPQIKLFENDVIQIEDMQTEELLHQLAEIKNYGYNVASSKIKIMKDYIKLEEKVSKLNELTDFIETNNLTLLRDTIDNSFYKLDGLESVRGSLKKLSGEERKIKSLDTIEDIKQTLDSKIYTELNDSIIIELEELTEINNTLKEKMGEISEKEKGNELLAALSSLVVNREELMNYKNEGNENCPLCGSNELFSSMTSYEELALEAKSYIERIKADLLKSKQEMHRETQIYNMRLKGLKEKIIQFILKELDSKRSFEASYNEHYNKTKEFFEKILMLNIPIDSELIINVIKQKTEHENAIATKKVTNSESLSLVQKILTTLNHNNTLEVSNISVLEKLNLELRTLITDELDVNNFDFNIFNRKKLFIENLLNNNKVAELEAKLLEYEETNSELDRKIVSNNRFRNKAELFRNEIERKKTNIEKIELEEVGKYLYKIYTKVIKHTKIKEFRLKRDAARINSGGATFSDQNGNNIHNVMSQGQLGVFILSYFFANMFKRKEETIFKTYFIDDITSSMDDMNVLSFVDIIKYQLSTQDGVIDQIFFSTCDSDLEKLLIHKMKSFSVDWINIKFTSYAKGTVIDNYKETIF